MISVTDLFAFGLATFGETINPGPTVGAVVSARARSRRQAWGVVIGITIANIVWVIAVLVFSELFASQLLSSPYAVGFLKALAALVLVFIATRAAVSAVVTGVDAYISNTWGAPPFKDSGSLRSGTVKGFMVHLANPWTATYYLGAYSGSLAIDPSLALVFALVAVLVDFLAYAVLASFPVSARFANSPMIFVFQRVFALIAGFAMLFLVARVFAIDRGDQLHGLRNLAMLLGFLAGAIYTAEEFAALYGGQKNKLLWRGLLVWQSAFGIFAIIGAFLSVLVRMDPNSVGIPTSWISEMAICALVAAVATVALSYARARGEMLDEAATVQSPNLARTKSVNGPKLVFPLLIVGLILLSAFFFVSGFSD